MSTAKENKLVRGADLTTIASNLKTYIQTQLGYKFGSVYFNSNTNALCFFKDDDDRDDYVEDTTQTNLILSSIVLNTTSNLLYRVALTTGNSVSGQYNTMQVSANAESLNLIMDFDIQVSTLGSEIWTSTGQSARFRLYTINANNVRTEIPLYNPIYFAGQTFTFNIMPYLPIGTTRVEIVACSESNDTITASFTYQIIVSEMYIEESNNNWYNAIVENGLYDANYKLGGFKIIGSMSKTLHIELYQQNNLVKSFERIIGQSSYNDESPYYYTHQDGFDMQSDNSNLTTGVYTVKAYLTSDTLTSLPVIYNIMYVAEDDINTAQLVCINNAATIAYNYSSLNLCDYAIYNRGAATGDPHLLLNFITGTTPSEKENKDLEDTTTGILHHLNYTIEWLTEQTVNLFVNLTLSLGESAQILNIPIDNSATYPAETGAVFYLNSTTRNNTDTNRTKIVNEATLPSTELTPTWTKMSWVNGIDGWTTDQSGRKCLLIPAKSSMSLPYQILTGENITIELCYRVANVVDYDENVITIASNPTNPGFHGIRIKPTNVTVHSSADTDASKDTERGTNLSDETTHHLVITIANTYSGNTGKNLVTGYVDGSVGFQFKYDSGTSWANNVPLIIGSQYSDVYIYFIRVYNSLLGKSGIEKNYINSLNGLAVREAAYNQFYSIVKQTTHEITYENISRSNKNFFVVEMLNDATIPSRANNWSKDTKGKSNFEMHFGLHPLWDFKLYNVETAGQGTTSMDYYRWNLRFRIDKSNDDKKIDIAYYDSPVIALDGSKTYNEQATSNTGSVFFDGGTNNTIQQHPKIKRITAKINFASSMQSHKIGATRAYDALRTALELSNAAQDFAKSQDPQLPKPVTAVYQYPAYGFSKTVSEQGVVTYEYIGLFTIGPDKGDKATFGYDIDDTIKNNLITMEGTDHSRRMAKFLYPWNSNVAYRASNECLNIVLANSDLDNAWEVSNCYNLSTDKASDQAAIQTKLEAEFKPAYDLVYNNSTQIFPIALNTYGATAAATLTAINADIVNFRKTQYNSRFTYADMEFWIEGEYVLYYYDIVQNRYVAGVNLITDLNQGQPTGSTLAEKNEWFKQKRRDRFKASAENYWDIQDAIYHFLFILWFGATDNFAKNTYPYKMGNLANGGRWMWRQDDLDTIFDIDNTGGQTKPYYIEYEDAHDGSGYFAGSTSVFWNLLYETYWEDYGTSKGIRSLGKDFITAMANLGTGSNTFIGCRNFINAYFWNNAQNYFNQAAYNVDTVYKYESAWLANGQAVDPLSQSLGNHYSAEQLWVDRRIVYMMSLFKCGPFGSYGDQSLGAIQFRPQSLASLSVKPIINMYPALANGAGSPATTARTTANTTYTFTGPFGDGNTTFSIQGTDYLTSLGDWKDVELGTGSGGLGNVEIDAKKLKTFKIGDDTALNVTTNIPSVSFPNNKCLEEINAKNASSLTGSVDLSNCTRLVSADFTGTNVTQVNLPTGSKIEHLHLSDNTKAIILKNLKFLSDLTLPSDLSGINTVQVENCTYQGALDMLRSLYNSNNSALQYIRVIWSDSIVGSVEDMQMLASIKQNKDKNGNVLLNPYGGIAANGNTTNVPVIEGTINLTTGLYTDDLEIVGTVGEPEVIDGTVVKARTEAFGTLYIIYDSARIYINFEDSAVRTLCINNFSSDNVGVTLNDASNTPSDATFKNVFRNNTTITKFNEYKYFTSHVDAPQSGAGNTNNLQGCFEGCTALTEITLPDTMKNLGTNSTSGKTFYGNTSLESVKGNGRLEKIGYATFYNCTSLEEVPSLYYTTLISNSAFANCSSLEIDLNLPNLTTLGTAAFKGSGIKKILSLGSITQFPGSNTSYEPPFMDCTNLTTVVLPSTLTSSVGSAFANCTALTSVDFSNAPLAVSSTMFNGCTSLTEIKNTTNFTSIGNWSFGSCPLVLTLTTTTFPNVTSIGREAFRNKSDVTGTLYLPNLTSLGGDGYQFAGTGIEHITSLGTVTSLPHDIFSSCADLEDVTFPSNTITTGTGVFYHCTSLSQITNSTSVIPNGKQCFDSCALTSFVQSSATTTVGERAFQSCTSLGWYDFNNASCSLTGYAFNGCTSLQEIRNYSNITSINGNAFASTDLRMVLSSSSFPELTSLGRGNFENNSNITGVVHMPKLTSLGNYAFARSGITSITNLGNITTLNGANEFEYCTSLTTVTMPTHYINLVGSTFKGCTSLTTVNNSDYIATIGNYVFQGCSSLPSFKLINDTISIGVQAFDGCSSLTTFDFNHATVTIAGDNTFRGCPLVSLLNTENLLRIPTDWFGSTPTCRNTLVWNLTNQSLPNITTISQNAFKECTGVTGTVYLPSLTGTLNTNAFYGTGIQHVTNLGSITTINPDAIAGCASLTDIVIPSTVTSISYGLRTNKALLTIEMNPTTPPTLHAEAFGSNSSSNDNALVAIYVPDTSLADYRKNTNTCYFKIRGLFMPISEKSKTITRNYGNYETRKCLKDGDTVVTIAASDNSNDAMNSALTDYIEIPTGCTGVFLNTGYDVFSPTTYNSDATRYTMFGMYDSSKTLIGETIINKNNTNRGNANISLSLTSGTKYVRFTFNTHANESSGDLAHVSKGSICMVDSSSGALIWPAVTFTTPS